MRAEATVERSCVARSARIVNYTTAWDDVRETLEAVERFGREALSKSGPAASRVIGGALA